MSTEVLLTLIITISIIYEQGKENSMSENQVEEIMLHHIDAVGSGNMEEILKDYTEESLIISPEKTYQGLKNLPPFFTSWIEGVPPGAGELFEITHQHIVGEVAYIVWKMGDFVPFATDTYVIRDGKIMLHLFAPYLPKKQMQGA